jgi:hypothetical protein
MNGHIGEYLANRGKLLRLYNYLRNTRNMSYKAYHDAVLLGKSMPVEMLRALLTGRSLDRSFTSNWRFYQGSTSAK